LTIYGHLLEAEMEEASVAVKTVAIMIEMAVAV
jgi:hypothetical protein